MGQHHQVFVITRVAFAEDIASGKRTYCCIAVLDDSWCFGRSPAKNTRRFLDLAKQPLNASILRFEIEAIQGNIPSRSVLEEARPMDSAWNCGDEESSEIPCPYVSFLLASAWNANLACPDKSDEKIQGNGVFGCTYPPGIPSFYVGMWCP